MSVRLIVVALLAAAVTTVAADDTATTTAATEKVVRTTFCEHDTTGADKCECAAPLTRTFPTVCPKEAGEDNLFWKADNCTDDAAAFVVKGYKTNACTAGKLTVSTSECRAAVYSKAECDASNKLVKLYGGCSSTNCNDCKEPITFTIDNPECIPWGDKFIKLAASTKCPSESEDSEFTFEQYKKAGCTDTKEETDLKIKKACTATGYYGKASCTDDKASFQSCAPKDGSAPADCAGDTCTTVEVKLSSYETILNGETLFLDKCPAEATPTEISFEVYAGLMEYKKECAGDTSTGYANATCADADVLSIKTCDTSATDCTCADSITKKYTAGVCYANDGKSWMVDSCEANVLKQYSDKDCTMEIFAPKMGCSAVSYYRAECGKSGDKTVKLYAGCNTKDCESGKGDNGCRTPTTFTSTDDTNSCKKAGTKYYKLKAGQCSGDASSVTFIQYNERDEKNACKGESTEVEVPLQCTATGYQKVTCTDGKATIAKCTSDSCDSHDCKPALEVPLKEYKQTTTGGSYLYIDSCPTDTDAPVPFQVYADVMKYQLGCHGHTEATCGEKTTTTTIETSITTETTTISTGSSSDSDGIQTTSTEDTTSSNNSSGLDDGSSNDTTSNSSTDDGIIAPAHSVGVLALVLCLLACVY